MSAYLETLYSDLRSLICRAWPDVATDGVYEVDHLDMLPVEELAPPYAVIALSNMTQDTELSSLDSLSYLPVLDIYCIEAVSGPRSPIRQKLETLRDALWTQPLPTCGLVSQIPSLDWSTDIEMNGMLAAKGLPYRAGRLQVSILIGEVF